MKVRQILESNHNYEIVSVDADQMVDAAHLTSKKDHIKVPYHDLERLFGKPKSFTHDHDVAHEWIIEFEYKDPWRDDPEDTETVVVTIYDRWDHGDPSDIDEWDVGAHDYRGSMVLRDYLESKLGR